MNENTSGQGNSTTNAILVILIVIIVAFAVWYMTIRQSPAPQEQPEGASIELNLGGGNTDDTSGTGDTGTQNP